jgi:hypothetical protein
LMDVTAVVAHPRPLHFVRTPPPPVILPSCHAPPHVSILAPPLCSHRLVVASPLVASASAFASLPLCLVASDYAGNSTSSAAPMMTTSGPLNSCSCWQSRHHCPHYCWRSAASTTMGPHPSSYKMALISVDTCTGGLHPRPPLRRRPRPAQRRRHRGRHFSCLC